MEQDSIISVCTSLRGQELYLDAVYIFQETEMEEKQKFLVFNYRAAMAKSTRSVVVLKPTA